MRSRRHAVLRICAVVSVAWSAFAIAAAPTKPANWAEKKPKPPKMEVFDYTEITRTIGDRPT